jgi:hypothetical protein
MSSELPFVSCLCPTYRRPQMMANTIPCFITQDDPADRRELIILDDAGELKNEVGQKKATVKPCLVRSSGLYQAPTAAINTGPENRRKRTESRVVGSNPGTGSGTLHLSTRRMAWVQSTLQGIRR